MSFWSGLLKYGGKAMGGVGAVVNGTGSVIKGTGKVMKPIGNSALGVVAHPVQTVRGVGTAVKATAGAAAVGAIGWEKLTTDKSVARIVSDAVIGESATDKLAGVGEDIHAIKESAGNAVETIGGAASSVSSSWNGISNFLSNMTGGTGADMFGNFFSNLGRGNVSGLSIAGLVAAAYMIFGRTGFLGKIAGMLLGMFLIGGNSQRQAQMAQAAQPQLPQQPQRDMAQAMPSAPTSPVAQEEERQVINRGMRR